MRKTFVILAVLLIIGAVAAWGLGLFGGEGFFSSAPGPTTPSSGPGLSLSTVKVPKIVKDVWDYLSGDLFPAAELLKTPRPKASLDMFIKSILQGLILAGVWRITKLLAPFFGAKSLVEDAKKVPKGIAGWFSTQVEKLVGRSPLRKRFFWLAVAEIALLIAYFLVPAGNNKNLLGKVGIFVPPGIGAVVVLVYVTSLVAEFIQKILMVIAQTVGMTIDAVGFLAKLILVAICVLPIFPMVVPEVLTGQAMKATIAGLPDLARLGIVCLLVIISASLYGQLGLEKVPNNMPNHVVGKEK